MFKINLATKIYIDARLLRNWTSAALVILALLFVLGVRTVAKNISETRDLSSQIAVMEVKVKSANKGVTEKGYKALLERISFANSVIVKKKYNWLELLDMLEKVVPDGVAITSIEPDTRTRDVKLAGVARSFKNLRIFMEHLEDSKFFTDVYLLNQGTVMLGDLTQGITFNVICKVTAK